MLAVWWNQNVKVPLRYSAEQLGQQVLLVTYTAMAAAPASKNCQ